MNKRIQELLQQCTYQIPGIGEEFNQNRFVKLIIEEIGTLVETDVPVSDQYKEGRRSLYRHITKHFGIE